MPQDNVSIWSLVKQYRLQFPDAAYEEFMKAYPRCGAKKETYNIYCSRLNRGHVFSNRPSKNITKNTAQKSSVSAESSKYTAREEYLEWALRGSLRGWADLLLRDMSAKRF